MAYNLKSESDVKEYLTNLGTEYRFGCYSEKNPEGLLSCLIIINYLYLILHILVCHLLGDYLEAIDKDYKKAGKVYKANCDDLQYSKSCYKYATYSLLGRGVPSQNYKEAYKYFETACNLDYPEACLHQGLLLTSKNESSGIPTEVLKVIILG